MIATLVVLASLNGISSTSLESPPPSLELHAQSRRVELGKAFELTVTRRWPEHLRPEPWADELLSPLSVIQRSKEIKLLDGVQVEKRFFHAYAFSLRDIEVQPTWHLHDPNGGSAIVADAQPWTFTVLTQLDPQTPGPAELPRGPFPAESSTLAASFAIVALLLVVGLGLWVIRKRSSREEPERPRPSEVQRFQDVVRTAQGRALASSTFVTKVGVEVRPCLERLVNFTCPDQSNEQFAASLRQEGKLDSHVIDTLVATLERWDRLRFSGDEGRDDEIEALIEITLDMLRHLEGEVRTP